MIDTSTQPAPEQTGAPDLLDAITRALAARVPGADPKNLNITITECIPTGGQHTWKGTVSGLAVVIHLELTTQHAPEDDSDDRNMACGESGCLCYGVGEEHADCACGCDCPRYTNEVGDSVIVGSE